MQFSIHASKHKYGKSLIFINSLISTCTFMQVHVVLFAGTHKSQMLPQLSLRQDISHLFQNKPQT